MYRLDASISLQAPNACRPKTAAQKNEKQKKLRHRGKFVAERRKSAKRGPASTISGSAGSACTALIERRHALADVAKRNGEQWERVMRLYRNSCRRRLKM